MKTRRNFLLVCIGVLLIGLFFTLETLAAGKVVIYSPAPKSTSDTITEMWNKKYPDIQIEIISAGTGELATRIKTERYNPRADVLLTGGQETLDTMLDLFQPYKCANDSAFKKEFKHPEYYYYAFSLPLQVFIINTKLVSEAEAPKTWTELGDPKWKGKTSLKFLKNM